MTRSVGLSLSYGTPLGLIATRPSARSMPLALPKKVGVEDRFSQQGFKQHQNLSDSLIQPSPNVFRRMAASIIDDIALAFRRLRVYQMFVSLNSSHRPKVGGSNPPWQRKTGSPWTRSTGDGV
jgi:hypothetical protein